jgi:hypothetical protein
MTDPATAGLILTFLVGLAILAPIWGVDSRDSLKTDHTWWPG